MTPEFGMTTLAFTAEVIGFSFSLTASMGLKAGKDTGKCVTPEFGMTTLGFAADIVGISLSLASSVGFGAGADDSVVAGVG